MKIVVNGAERETGDATTIAEIVETERGRSVMSGVAVALNGEVVTRKAWGQTRVANGDRIEILVATQGG
ncbi:MAG TPA: sulfur carrier protein ThiS [Actinomycetota bacterium]|nr:sulfur carrier protein ThiS [Actinomycetota bacterium]